MAIATPGVIEDASDAARIIEALLEHRWVGMDCETFGHPELTTPARREDKEEALDPLTVTVRTLQLSTAESTWVIDLVRCGLTLAVLKPLIPNTGFVIHFSRFELGLMMAAGLDIHGIHVWDTHLASKVLGAGTYVPNKLEEVVKRYLDRDMDKAEQTSDWAGDLTPEQIRYAREDVEVLIPLQRKLWAELKEHKLTEVAGLEFRAIPAIAAMEHYGVPVDRQKWEELADTAEQKAKEAEDKLNELVGPIPEECLPPTKDERKAASGRHSQKTPEERAAMVEVYRQNQMTMFDALDVHREPVYVNWSSPPQVLAVFKRRGIDLPKSDKNQIAKNAHRDPALNLLREYRDYSKLAAAFGHKFLRDNIHPKTGRIHPNWNPMGAEATGRFSSSKPNFQQIPKRGIGKVYRYGVRAPEGKVLVRVDYSQIELRIAAELANEAGMLAAYNGTGADLHTQTARAVLGKEEITDNDRTLAKAVGFGFLYGMGAEKFQAYSLTNYGIPVTLEQAKSFQQNYFRQWPGLKRWHKRVPDSPIATRTVLGRRRLEVKDFQQKVNTPVQGTGADMVKASIVALWEEWDLFPEARLIMTVHDELVMECPAEQGEQVRDWMIETMTRQGQQFLKLCRVKAEGEIGTTWGGND